jgi:hypothetical protein
MLMTCRLDERLPKGRGGVFIETFGPAPDPPPRDHKVALEGSQPLHAHALVRKPTQHIHTSQYRININIIHGLYSGPERVNSGSEG